KDVFDVCAFLHGTLESLTPGNQIELGGIHHQIDGIEHVVDVVVRRNEEEGFVLAMQDQTDRYLAVNQLSQQRNEADMLQHQLARQNEQLLILKDAAETASRTRTEFLATVSHEIRTPLNALIGFAGLIEEHNLTPNQARQLSGIKTAGETLASLLNDILDLSKIESGKYQLALAPFALKDMLEDTLSLVRQQAITKGLELKTEIDPDIPIEITGDRMRLSQVLLNLLNNAIKFTDKGYVLLRARVTDFTDTSYLVLFEIEDSGRGIAIDQQQQIFEEFQQNRGTDATELGGFGLGLAIVRQLVDAMSGSIELVSELGEGSTFRIRVPLAGVVEGAHAVPCSEEEGAEDVSLDGLCVLLAEDNTINQQYVHEVLTTKKCKVLVVDNGAAAIKTLKTEPVDLVLMDVVMPEMAGDEAIQKIRDSLLFPLNCIPIIVLSGRAGGEEADNLLRIGADDILVKPYSPDTLVNKLREVVGRKRFSEPANVDSQLSDDVSAEMIRIYRSEVPAYLRDLLLSLYSQNENRFIFHAHKMQSAMWVMEYMETYELLERLENEPLSFEQRYLLCEQVSRAVEDSLRPKDRNSD
ncbi:MAG: ATP-binding protein, partial [bacterium]